ncbi:MAG: carbohydrate kinase family protein [Deinococcus sp.]|nr:carbohydrate kinase family protein [Deinococcus sp.]
MRFFVLGDVSVDIIYFLDRIPDPGEETPSQRVLLKPGGAGGTLAAQLASLGHQVSLAGRVGNDAFRALALTELERTGVDLKYLQEDPQNPTSSIVILLVPGGERAMISAPGASRFLDAAEFKPKMLDGMDAMVLSAYALVGGPQREYAIKALEAARKKELPIFVDLGSGAVRSSGTSLLEHLRGVNYMLMNQHELLSLTGTDAISTGVEALKQYGLDNVVVKVGAMGSIVVTPEQQELVEPFPLEDVVDTTGAGDAFTAAFVHAVMAGRNLLEAARLGNLAGSLAATAVGAQGRLITPKDLKQARL